MKKSMNFWRFGIVIKGVDEQPTLSNDVITNLILNFEGQIHVSRIDLIILEISRAKNVT